MASSHLRSTLAATARCCPRRSKSRINAAFVARHASTWTAATGQTTPSKLETVDDWTEFQLKRSAYQELLSEMSQYGSTQRRDNTFQPHHSLHRPPAPANLTLSALLASGAHFGHAKSLMNPNYVPYAYGTRAGITIIDLEATLPLLRRAAQVVRAVAANDGTVVFVGTRPDLRPTVRKAAERMGQRGFHVGEKWLPGTLTNRLEVFGSDLAHETRIVPDLVVLLNPIPNMHVIRECAIEHVPTIALVDSNVDPRVVMYPIPANDDSTRAAELIAGVLSIAGREGAALAEEKAREQRMETERRHKILLKQERARRMDPRL